MKYRAIFEFISERDVKPFTAQGMGVLPALDTLGELCDKLDDDSKSLASLTFTLERTES